MKTTQEKLEAFNQAIDEFEEARDACADAISDIVEDLHGTPLGTRLGSAEPDGNVVETLRNLHDEIENGSVEEDEEDEEE